MGRVLTGLLILSLTLPGGRSQAASMAEALRAMADGDVGRARSILDDLIGPRKPHSEEARLLKARALFTAKQFERSAAVYRRVLESARPGSNAIHQARFGLAECLAKQGRFDRAEALFSESLAALTAPARRDEVAQRFIRLGEEELEPPEGQGPADPGRAESFFRAALGLKITGELEERTSLLLARSLIDQKRAPDAANHLIAFLEDEDHEKSARRAEVSLLAGEQLIEASDPHRARRYLRDLLTDHPRSKQAADAAYLLSRTHGMPNPGSAIELARGQAALRHFIARYPKHKKASEARLELALAPLNMGRQAEAEDELRALIAAGGSEDLLGSARYQLGVCLAAQGLHLAAAKAWRDYLKRHPAHKYWSQARTGVERMDWERAEVAYLDEKWPEAAKLFSLFAESHPAAVRAPEALHKAAEAHLKAKQPDAALEVLATLTGKFAEHAWGHRGLLLTGQVHEVRLDFTKARESYERAAKPGSPVSAEAQSQLSLLEEPSLLIESPLNFRAAQKPHLTWHVRNLEKVTIRAFRIQAEDFFRDRLGMDEITSVDIALCEPDKTWTVPVAGYRKYARIEQKVRLPFDKPGLYLLNLTAGDLEATTAVLVTDLGVILKTGGDEVFVFTQDLGRYSPHPGAKVLVADGGKILFEGETGRDGVWRKRLPANVDLQQLDVFVANGNHVAWTGQENTTTYSPSQLSPRAFVFPDRPVYRPGDQVHLSGIFRGVREGQYTFSKGDRLKLRVSDAAGALIHEESVVLDEYGVFHKELSLDTAAREGLYRFSVEHKPQSSFSGTFQVRRFRRLPFDLRIRLDKPVFFRGENLTGIIEVSFLQGTPAPDQEVTYLLVSERKVRTARTDEAGQVRFSFPTRAYEDSQSLKVQAHLGRSRQLAEASALLAVADLEIEFRVEERTLFAGQPFDAGIRVKGPDGSPRAARVTVQAMRRDPRAGGELRVFNRTVEINDSGQGNVRVKLDAEGTHVLRAYASDRAGHPVVAERLVNLVGEEAPGIWLDVAGEAQTLSRPAGITVHSRAPKALVLLTAETERILVYRTLVVNKGKTEITIPMQEALAPNFLLAAASMTDDKLHLASRSVRIDQQLQIKIRADKPEYRPGDEVTLTMVVTDAAGKPADARLLIAVVDEALLAAFPEGLPSLLGTFHITRTEGEIETRASNTHRFDPVEAEEVVRAEVREAEGSAALKALASRRKVMTEKAIGDFDELAARESMGMGGLGTSGYGSGGGGLGGRGRGVVSVKSGMAKVTGGLGRNLRRSFQETAVFLHQVKTGPDGVASAVFRLPDSITRWRVTARGVTRDTRLGEARETLTASRPFWVQLVMPPVLEQGDTLAPLARLVNHTGRSLDVSLKFQHAGKQQTAKLEVAAQRSADHLFEMVRVPVKQAPGQLEFVLEAAAGTHSDAIVRKVAVRPRGVREEKRAEGLVTKSAKRDLILAEGLTAPRLEVRLSNRLARFFLGDQLDPLLFGDRPEEALVGLALLDLLGKKDESAMRDLARQRTRRALTHLMAVQQNDGGWGWSRGSRGSSLEVSAAAIRALALAKPLAAELAWPHPQAALDKGATWLSGKLGQLAPDDFRRRTEAVYALAHLGKDRIPNVLLHRLHRLRRELGLGSQALLGLTWVKLGRPEQAAEVLAAMDKGFSFGNLVPVGDRWLERSRVTELDRVRALALLAEVRPTDPRLERGKTWLLTRGRFFGWSFPSESAAALRTLDRLLAATGTGQRARIGIQVNGKPAGTIEITGPDALETLQVPAGLLKTGTNTLELDLVGGGGALFSARLSGYRAEPPKPDPKAKIRIQRHLEPVPVPYRGNPIRAGFSVVTGRTEPWVNQIDKLPAGRRVEVSLKIERDFASPLDHCVILERLPPGFELEEGSVSGSHTHMLREGRRLAFYLTAGVEKMKIGYRLVAVNPGTFRFAPVRLISLSDPETSLTGPTTDFGITSASSPAPEVRATPLELYQRGLAATTEKDHPEVVKNLENLWENFELRNQFVSEVLGKLLFASIAQGDHPRILKYFELSKEKNPALVIPFDQITPVQEAYRQAKAYEGGLYLAKGLAEAQFVRELRAIGQLEAQDEMAEALDMLRKLLLAYPDNRLTAKAAYAFSQVIYGRADRIAEGEELEGFDRPGLLDEVAALMATFLGRHPDHPEAPAAIFSLSSALIERDHPDQAIDWCAVGLEHHAKSDLAPELAYLKAFAHFRRGEYGPSLKLCRQVAQTAKTEDNIEMARYIMAQIHHARGEVDEALANYRLVQERFRDAAETIRDLEQAWFEIPEVARFPAGKRPALEVTARNVAELDLRAYKVDLMKLYLLKGSLRDLQDINLAGIKPIFSKRIRLKAGRRPGRMEHDVPLRLPGKGAYLVLARGGAKLAHSLVLVDALDLEVSEVLEEGRARVAVRNAKGRSLAGARVQLKGDDNERFTAGKTDLRGIFIGDEIEGRVTVIALHQGAYGLYRGSQPLVAGEPDVDGEYEEHHKQGPPQATFDFDNRMIRGQANQADESAIDFFNQDVQGMKVQQALH